MSSARNSLFVIAACMLSSCAAHETAPAQPSAQQDTSAAQDPTESLSEPEGVAYQPGEVTPLLSLPDSVGKLELEYVFRYTDTGRGDLYLYGGDVLMRPEVGVLPLDARLAQLMHSGQRKQALRMIYDGLRQQVTAAPGMAAPDFMHVTQVDFIREEMREATWTRRGPAGKALHEETLPAVFAVYDLQFADGSSARSYFWLTEYAGHMLRIKMTEFPYPGLEENFLSFARQVMTAVFRGSTAPKADSG